MSNSLSLHVRAHLLCVSMTDDRPGRDDIVISRHGDDIQISLCRDDSLGSPWDHARPSFSPDSIILVRLKQGIVGERERVCHIVPYRASFPSSQFETYCELTIAYATVDVVDFDRNTGAPCLRCYEIAHASFNAALDVAKDDEGAAYTGKTPGASPVTEYLRDLATKIPTVADMIDASTINPERLLDFASIMRWSATLCEDVAMAEIDDAGPNSRNNEGIVCSHGIHT